MASPDESWNAAAICQALGCPGCFDCRDDDSDATWDGKDDGGFWACPKPDCTTPRSEPGDCPRPRNPAHRDWGRRVRGDDVIPRIGSLFTGYAGLDRAVQQTLGGQVAWYSENNQAASNVLAHHHPDVPNLGDITTINWGQVAPVDILTGGFPCQDVSSAGRRAGMGEGTRSGLWAHMATAVDRLHPQLVVIENVRGLTSARADCDLEPCPWCLGDDEHVHLRALGCVLGDLADIGYDAQWCGLRAADVGAAHGRYRLFVVATPADTTSQRHGNTWAPGIGGIQAATVTGDQREAAADTAGEGRGQSGSVASGQAQGAGSEARRAAGRGGGASAADAGRVPFGQQPVAISGRGGSSLAGLDHPSPSDADGAWEQQREGHEPDIAGRSNDSAAETLDWGQFEPAIRRWETILGRSAPEPTVPGRRTGRVLNPVFVEFLMGLPEGHVTGVPGLSRNDMLRLLGNGVVTQQAVAALRWLLPAITVERVA